MHTIVQLSDLHMSLGAAPNQAAIFDALIEVLRARFAGAGRRADLLAITGDVFDSALQPAGPATAAFRELHARIIVALGTEVPTVIIPGNHDRRRRGFVGPHDTRLFSALAKVMGDRAYVHGSDTPFLASVVPRAYHGLPIALIAYDSTYLPRGLLSAGGVIRREDLLRAAAAIEPESQNDPVVLLLHHHLVPTPLTDVGSIDMSSATRLLRVAVNKVLPMLIANADREELTMTALGAGTAISTLHELGRSVLVLHGHKHYATARMLRGMIETQGDVLIVSAGSCGMAEPWSPAVGRDAAKLWPSFNVIELGETGALNVEMLSFGYKGNSARRFARRELVRAQRRGSAWDVTPVPLEQVTRVGPELTRNHRYCRVSPSQRHGGRWDFECVRTVEGNGASPRRYIEMVGGLPGSQLFVGEGGTSKGATPTRLELTLGREIRYRVEAGLCRTIRESALVYGNEASPYEWLGLMNRYACDEVVLEVEGLGAVAKHAFASITDLGTGIEQPLALTRGDKLHASVKACPARTLVRVYFPLSE